MSNKKINSENKIEYNNMNTFNDKVSVINAKYIYNLDFNTFKATFWDKNELNQCNNIVKKLLENKKIINHLVL